MDRRRNFPEKFELLKFERYPFSGEKMSKSTRSYLSTQRILMHHSYHLSFSSMSSVHTFAVKKPHCDRANLVPGILHESRVQTSRHGCQGSQAGVIRVGPTRGCP